MTKQATDENAFKLYYELVVDSKEDFLERVEYVRKVRAMNKKELKKHAGELALLGAKSPSSGGPPYKKHGFLYVYRRKD